MISFSILSCLIKLCKFNKISSLIYISGKLTGMCWCHVWSALPLDASDKAGLSHTSATCLEKREFHIIWEATGERLQYLKRTLEASCKIKEVKQTISQQRNTEKMFVCVFFHMWASLKH